MNPLNYHHLLYFWTVARVGSVSRAAEQMHVAQPTVSAQLRLLERQAGGKLFDRRGRHLELTELGRTVLQYADEIFAIGNELQDLLAGRPTTRALRFTVGVQDALPKLITYRILEPVLTLTGAAAVQLICLEGKLDDLYGEMAHHRLDLLLADSPAHSSLRGRLFSHLLGECAITVFGTAALARKYKRNFPRSLDGAPLLLPRRSTLLRRAFDQWLDEQELRPRVVGEIEDSALLKTFGQAGAGLFLGPAAIEREICHQYEVGRVGRLDAIHERFYLMSPERRLKHPATVQITQAARNSLFR